MIDLQYQRMLRETLLHTVEWWQVSSVDPYGAPTYPTSPTATVPCLLVHLPLSRVLSALQNNISVQIEVYFKGNLTLGINDKLTKGKDRFGSVLVPTAKIMQLDQYDHPRQGRLSQVAFCQLQ